LSLRIVGIFSKEFRLRHKRSWVRNPAKLQRVYFVYGLLEEKKLINVEAPKQGDQMRKM
jgi:hypothetical protein